MMYIGHIPGTPVFRYDVPYGTLEEMAYRNPLCYGDDPDWAQVRADLQGLIDGMFAPLMLEIDDINRRSEFHEVVFAEDPCYDSYHIWIADRDPGEMAYGMDEVMAERAEIVRRLGTGTSHHGFYVIPDAASGQRVLNRRCGR